MKKMNYTFALLDIWAKINPASIIVAISVTGKDMQNGSGSNLMSTVVPVGKACMENMLREYLE